MINQLLLLFTSLVLAAGNDYTTIIQGITYPSPPARNLDDHFCHQGAYCDYHDHVCKFTKNSIKCAWDKWKCSDVNTCGDNQLCWELQNKFKDITWLGLSLSRCELQDCLIPRGRCCNEINSVCEACRRCMTEEDYCLLPTNIRIKSDGFIPPGCFCSPGTYSQNGDNFSPCLPCGIAEGNTGGNDPCAPCPPGSFNPEAGMPCGTCPYPYYQPDSGQIDCIEGTVLSCELGQGWTKPTTIAEGFCTDCGPGTYAPTTTTEGCLTCPAGQHQADSKQSSCDRCPDDTTSAASSDGDEDCIACTIDQDCRVRTTVNGKECKRESPDNLGCRSKTEAKDGRNWCETIDGDEDYCIVHCPPGYEPVLNADKGVAFYECNACAAGKASPGYDAVYCSVCAAGEYTTDGTACESCTMSGVANWIQTFTGWTSDDDCIASSCDAGYKRENNKCVACPGGQWSAAGATACTDDSTDLNDCGGNQHFVEGTDNTADDAGCVDDDVQQSDCVAGEYYSAGANNVADDSSCEDCNANQHSADGAASCTDDTYSVHTDCDAGTFFVVGTDNTADDGVCSTCTEPTAAQYVTVVCSTQFDTQVADCTAPADDGSNYISQACSKGSSAATGSDTIRTDCSGCAAGKYISTACSAGSINIAGNQDSCTNCAAGTYQDAADQTSCKDCSTGSTYSADGATSCTNCASPAATKYVSSTCTVTANTQFSDCAAAGNNQYQSTACSQGSSSQVGSAGATASCSNDCAAGKKQTDCVQGAWNNQGSDRSCVNCDAGKYSASGDTSCTACTAGTSYSAAGASSCTTCGGAVNNKYVSSACTVTSNTQYTDCTTAGSGEYQSTACVKGDASTTGSNGAKTSCSSNCAAGKKQTNCAQGSAHVAGSDRSCANCAAGKTSSSGDTSCTACDSGKYSAAGDSSCTTCTACVDGTSYQTTACSVTQNRVCTACTTCSDGTSYQTTACSGTTNRVCTTCRNCAAGKKISGGCTGTTDRTCADCTNPTCADGKYYTPCDGTTTTDPSCTDCTAGSTCTHGVKTACTSTADTVCHTAESASQAGGSGGGGGGGDTEETRL